MLNRHKFLLYAIISNQFLINLSVFFFNNAVKWLIQSMAHVTSFSTIFCTTIISLSWLKLSKRSFVSCRKFGICTTLQYPNTEDKQRNCSDCGCTGQFPVCSVCAPCTNKGQNFKCLFHWGHKVTVLLSPVQSFDVTLVLLWAQSADNDAMENPNAVSSKLPLI